MADAAEASPPKKKKLPFKRTIARIASPDALGINHGKNGGAKAVQDDDSDDGLSMFQRSKEMFPMAIEEQQRRMRRREEKRKSITAEGHGSPGHDRKRQRASLSEDIEERASGQRRDSISAGQQAYVSPKSPSSRGNSQPTSPTPNRKVAQKDIKGKGKEVWEPDSLLSPDILPLEQRSLNVGNKEVEASLRQPNGESERTVRESPREDIYSATPPLTNEVQRNVTKEFIREGPRGSKAEVERVYGAANVISLVDDDDSSHDSVRAGSHHSDPGFVDEDDIIEEDDPSDEFAVYMTEARERQKAKLKTHRDEPGGENGLSGKEALTEVPPEPVVLILISSPIPNTAEMLAKRGISRPLGLVLETWIAHQRKKGQALPEEMLPSLFMTFRGNKIYESTSCASLGIELDAAERPRRVGTYGGDDEGILGTKLHLQVWTEDLYAEYMKEKEHERLRQLGLVEESNDFHDPSDGEEVEAPAGNKIRVVLKAKNMEPLNVTIYGSTTVKTMVAVFRIQRAVPVEKEIALFLDGEQLELDRAADELDLEDIDNLDVYIK